VAKPTIDPTTSGISFVDILFALAVGEVLAPFVPWAASHETSSLPAPIVWNLAVALVLILTSFIGYHNSRNRPLFTIRFVNVSLCKFVLDISMVIVYFLFASFAIVSPSQTQTLLLLVVIVFGLYLLWDATSWYQKGQSAYKDAWTDAIQDPNRPDIVEGSWTAFDFRRTVPTIGGLAVFAGLYAWSVQLGTPPARHDVIAFDIVTIVVLVVYRIIKDNLPNPSALASSPTTTAVAAAVAAATAATAATVAATAAKAAAQAATTAAEAATKAAQAAATEP
jgi:hypothetical protein